MAGMFDFFAGPQAQGMSPEARQGIGQQSMLALASALLQAGGPSTRPVSFGQALGSALPGMIQAQQQGADRAQRQSIFDLQKRDLDRKDADATQSKLARERLFTALGNGGTDMGRPVDMKPLWAQAFPDQFASSEFDKLKPRPLIGVPEGGLYDPNKGRVVVQGTPKTPADVQAYQFARTPDGGNFAGTFEEWKRASQQGGQETFGNTPVWGTDEKGNPVLMQPSNRGGLRVAQMPPGVTPQRGGTSRVDLGTTVAILDANGTVIGYQPKDIAGEKRAGVVGTRQGENEVNAPGAVLKAEQMLTAVDGILNDPNLSKSVGVWSLVGAVPNTPQYDFAQRAQQLQGQAFLQAFESLKGGGQITEVEGNKAQQAIGRLSTAQSEKAYREALGELRGVIVAAQERQKKIVEGAATPPSLNTQKNPSGFSIRKIGD